MSEPHGPGAVPAGWYPDPFHRHELRWWDGSVFTDDVADAGRASTEPGRIPQPWLLMVLVFVGLTVTQVLAVANWNTPYRGSCPNEFVRPAGALCLVASWAVLLAGLLAGQWWDRRHAGLRRRFPAEVLLAIPAVALPALWSGGILLCGL